MHPACCMLEAGKLGRVEAAQRLHLHLQRAQLSSIKLKLDSAACRHSTGDAAELQQSRPLEELFAVLEATLNLQQRPEQGAQDSEHWHRWAF